MIERAKPLFRSLITVVVTALMMLTGVLAGGSASLTATAAPSAQIGANAITGFTDANRTVACQIVTADTSTPYDELRCDLIGGSAPIPLPPRPTDCPAEWAATVLLDSSSLPEWGACVGDTIAYATPRPAGDVVEAGAFRCTVLEAGVRCVNNATEYGFELSPSTVQFVRAPAESVLSARGIGKLKLGMSEKRGRATGQLGKAVCTSPQLKSRLGWSAYLSWRRGKLTSVLANSSTNLQSRSGVGVGSTLAQVQGAHPTGQLYPTTDLVEGTPAYVFMVKGKSGNLVFILQARAGAAPSAMTPVNALWAVKSWNPAKGYGFSGC